MLYCFDKRVKFDYTQDEINNALNKDVCIFYDVDTGSFIDKDGKEVDITGKEIFPRTASEQINDMNPDIIKKGGIPVVSLDTIEKIRSWPYYFSTDRSILVYKGKDLLDEKNIELIESTFGEEFFIKTKVKGFSSIISTNLLKNKDCAFYKALQLHQDEIFYLANKVKVNEDEHGEKEYRCFVIDGEIYNISRLTTKVLHSISKKTIDEIKKIVYYAKKEFGDYFVVDVFEIEKDGKTSIDVVEFNPIHASGIYLYNSIIDKSNDLQHNNIYNIAKEFIGKSDKISLDGEMINNGGVLYEIPGSFANDLRSIILMGNPGVGYTTFNVTSKFYGVTEPLFNPGSATKIESDEDWHNQSPKEHDFDDDANPDLVNEVMKAIRERKNKI